MTAPQPLTVLLESASAGDQSAAAKLMSIVYDQLRSMAAAQMAREAGDHTLQPTALVNEAFMRLFPDQSVQWENRRHFFGAAANAMRRILIEHARAARGPKRASPLPLISLDPQSGTEPGTIDAASGTSLDYLALDEALSALESHDPELANIVGLRFFAGLSIESVASLLGVSPRSVNRDWNVARAWLHRRMQGGAA